MTAEYLTDVINKEKGFGIKVNFTGAYDRFDVVKAEVITINIGKGFQEAIKVTNELGSMIYSGNFTDIKLPTKETMLLFSCNFGMFIKK